MLCEDSPGPKRNARYRDQFDCLSQHTSEYREMLGYFKAEVFPTLPAKQHFLDIGAGRGNYARPFARVFARTSVVEPNELFYQDIMAWARTARATVVGFNTDWQDLDWQDRDVDLALMSHMLYYVPRESRPAFIRKAYDALKPGGTLLIVLNSESCGIREVYKAFYPPALLEEMPHGEGVAALLRAEGYPQVEERVFPAVISLKSRAEAAELIDFLLLRRVSFDDEASRARQSAYIDAHLREHDLYRMDSQGTIVSVRKP